jgi:hypothetical protein
VLQQPNRARREANSPHSVPHPVYGNFLRLMKGRQRWRRQKAYFYRVLTNRSKTSVKLDSIRSLTQRGIPTCFRCGDRGHLSSSCRNSIVCFECGCLGHRSHHCRAITLLPPPSQPALSSEQMDDANRLPFLKLFPNQANKILHDTLSNSNVLIDEKALVHTTFNPILLNSSLFRTGFG